MHTHLESVEIYIAVMDEINLWLIMVWYLSLISGKNIWYVNISYMYIVSTLTKTDYSFK